MVDLKSVVSGPIEHKVTAATIGSYVASLAGLYAANLASGANVLSLFPRWVGIVAAPLVPAVVAFVSGYSASHTPRGTTAPDVPSNSAASPTDPHIGPEA